jgi:hypothetical protein
MIITLIIVTIVGCLYVICRISVTVAPESSSLQEWFNSIFDTKEGVILKKSFVVCAVIFGMLFSVAAYADSSEPSASPVSSPVQTETVFTSESTETPTATPMVTQEPIPTPEPTIPVIDENQYHYEVLDTLGNIQGYLIFFGVVLLCYFVYRFLRMFF